MTTPYQQPPQPPTSQRTAQWQGGGPTAGYTSPIPVRRTHLGDALASEWTKLRSVRSTMWTLGVMVVLMLGIGLLAALLVSTVSSDPATPSGQDALSLGFFGVLLGSMCVITLGVLTIASEYGTGMIRTTLTACPSRGRVLAAKSLVFFLLVFVISMVVTMTVAALQVSIVGAESPDARGWLLATAGVSLYLATLGLLSLAVGTLIRHSAGAITVMIGVVLLPLVLAMFMFSDSLTALRESLFDYSIPNQMAAFYSDGVRVSGPSGWEPLWLLLGVTAIALAAAYFALDKRDV
ncbi:ABC transporter permease subunit [Streptomyces sp. 35G-GA-8]|uniref:ABC transporter permease subunit n=1 Tax=Streptomyces sp. 35G-GA-8 TaxID=2939434 RepID=UPI00201F0992|nr:ABC transporter permease subunit [Streptomyces sp. 35G-GA-8]MCL7381575.1 ABC transporter permease [Streptomyces sp. 35G-GA-8]